MIMIMMRMTMTMTMIVVMSCGNSTSYVLTESPSTSQKAFCHCLYFSFQLQEISSSGPVCYPQRTYYFRNAGRLACFAFELPVFYTPSELTNISPGQQVELRNFFLLQSSPLYSRRYWKDKTLWQLKRKKNRGRGRIPTAYRSSFSKQGRVHLGVIGMDLSFNQFFEQRLKIWRAAGDIRPSRVTGRPETNCEGFWEQI